MLGRGHQQGNDCGGSSQQLYELPNREAREFPGSRKERQAMNLLGLTHRNSQGREARSVRISQRRAAISASEPARLEDIPDLKKRGGRNGQYPGPDPMAATKTK